MIRFYVFGGDCWNDCKWWNAKPKIWYSVGWVTTKTYAHALRQWKRIKPYWRKGSQLEVNLHGKRIVLRHRERIMGKDEICSQLYRIKE